MQIAQSTYLTVSEGMEEKIREDDVDVCISSVRAYVSDIDIAFVQLGLQLGFSNGIPQMTDVASHYVLICFWVNN